VGITEDILVRIRNSFIPMDFVVLEMDVYHQIPLILGRPFLGTTGATIDVAARIIKAQHQQERGDINIQTQGYQAVQLSRGHDQIGEECYDTR
jgi:hypothetical protein